MNTFYGSRIDFPFRADARGTFVTTADPETIVSQSIVDVIETMLGTHVENPGYGIRNWIFEVVGATFAARIAHELERQIVNYAPRVKDVTVRKQLDGEGRVELGVTYTLDGQINAPKNLVYPVWRLREG